MTPSVEGDGGGWKLLASNRKVKKQLMLRRRMEHFWLKAVVLMNKLKPSNGKLLLHSHNSNNFGEGSSGA